MYYVCTQEPGFPEEKEHIADKRQRAHRHLFVAAYLLENVMKSLDLECSFKYYDNILEYLFRIQEVLGKFCKVYFSYKINSIPREDISDSQKKGKIRALIKLVIALTKFVKVRVSVIIKDDPVALDLIHSIFGRKVNWRIQEYLVTIEYWLTKMDDEEKRKYYLS
ncbi:MAG: hypothetical protein MJE68_16790 [Proteobacteria bacterium]|nr:hypothetical protein [Pseudomonadota bacterium]